MKTTITIISLFLLFGCRTKVSTKEKEVTEQKTEIQIEKKIDSEAQEKEKKSETKKSDIQEQKKDSQTEINIKGKAETDKPIEFYDVENGDTLHTIKVIGNADVIINTKRSSTNNTMVEKVESSSQNIIEKISREVVKEKNLVKAGQTIKKTAKEVKITDTSTGIYITTICLGAVAIVMIFLFIYFKNRKQ